MYYTVVNCRDVFSCFVNASSIVHYRTVPLKCLVHCTAETLALILDVGHFCTLLHNLSASLHLGNAFTGGGHLATYTGRQFAVSVSVTEMKYSMQFD